MSPADDATAALDRLEEAGILPPAERRRVEARLAEPTPRVVAAYETPARRPPRRPPGLPPMPEVALTPLNGVLLVGLVLVVVGLVVTVIVALG